MGLGNFPVALIIFGGIAVFLVLRLRSVLGRRIGFEKPPMPGAQLPGFGAGPVLEPRPASFRAGTAVPDPRSALGARLMQIVNREPDFDPPKFLETAEKSFRTIVAAFAAGERATLKTMLSENVFQTFDAAITARETANERHRTEITGPVAADIEDAQLVGDHAAIIVRFTSTQVNAVLDTSDNPISGSTAPSEIIDLWTFERRLRAPDRTWRLAAARSG